MPRIISLAGMGMSVGISGNTLLLAGILNRPDHYGDMFKAGRERLRGGLVERTVIIIAEIIIFRPADLAFQEDGSNVGAVESGKDIRFLRLAGDKNHAIHALLTDAVDNQIFFGMNFRGRIERGRIAIFAENALEAGEHLREIRVGDIRQDDADIHRAAGFEAAGGGVWRVAQRRDCFLHLASGVRRNHAAPVQHIRDRPVRDARQFCDILDCCHCGFKND